MDEEAVRAAFARFGKIQHCIVKAAGKDKKFQSGFLVFESIVGAHSAVHGFADNKDSDFKAFKSVVWTSGKEPVLSSAPSPSPAPEPKPQTPKSATRSPAWKPEASTKMGDGTKKMPSFASFASSSASPSVPFSKSEAAQNADYESITLMRMREAEKRRLEADIRKKDEA